MATNTTSRPAEGLSSNLTVNAMNRARRFVHAPRTCIIPELFGFCEENEILLTKSVLQPEQGWIYIPGSGMRDVFRLDYDPPGVLFLQDRATRKDQLEVIQRMSDLVAVRGAK